MTHKLKTLIVSLSLLFSLSSPLVVAPSMVLAVDQTQINGALCKGAEINVDTNSDLPANSSACKNKTTGPNLTDILKKIINVLSLLVGAIAVIMIIVGGFRYVTSGGSDSATGAAKKTILYAIVGLVIVALAQVIVHFVLNNIT
jgi:cytochrome bd-type quinol oxidase subunit 2